MPEVTYSTKISVPATQVWAFVKDMNNWAPMLTGYQAHEIRDDRHSTWRLKGDVGILSREVQLAVTIDEWQEGEKVSFTLKGLNEQVAGGGTFWMRALEEQAEATAPEASKGLFARFVAFIFRSLFRRKFGSVERSAEGVPQAELTFSLRMEADGPTAPLVNAMLEPAILPATEDLANKIAAHLENAPRQLSREAEGV